jgi:hypothetical protein
VVHDCFGTIIQRKRKGVFEFLCSECFRPYATLTVRGLAVDSKHGSKKDKNSASLKTLKWMIAEVEAAGRSSAE